MASRRFRSGTVALLVATLLGVGATGAAPAGARAGVPGCPSGSVSWTNGAGDGNWFSAGNWSGGAVPSSSTTVCITAAATGGAVRIASGATAAAASVTSSQPITLTGGSTLTLSGSDGNQSTLQTLTLDGTATLTGADPLQIDGSLVWDGGATISDSATLTVASGATMPINTATDGYRKFLMSNLDLAGTATFNGATELDVSDEIQIEPSGTLNLDTTAPLIGGTIAVESGATMTCGANGSETVAAPVLNQGTISLDAGCVLGLNLGSDGGTDTGAFDVPPGATLGFGSYGDASPQTTFDPLDVSGGGTVALNGGFTTYTFDATTTIPSATVLQVYATTLNGSGTLDVDGTLDVEDQATFAGPTVEIPAKGVVDLAASSTETLGGEFDISGTLTESGSAGVNLSGATIDVDSGGQLDLDSSGTISGFSGPPASVITVQSGGMLACDATGTEVLETQVVNHGSVALANTCDLDLNDGSAGQDDTGEFSVPAGATLATGIVGDASPQTTFAPLNVVGAGTVQFAGGQFATVSIDAASTIPAGTTLELDSGDTINGTSPLTVDGTLLWDGSANLAGGLDVTVSLPGTLTIDSGVDSLANRYLAGTLTLDGGVAGTFSGAGPLDIQSTGSLDIAHGASFAIDNLQLLSSDPRGVIVNDGTLQIPPGDGGLLGSVENESDGTVVDDGELITDGTFTEAGQVTAGPVSIAPNGTLTFTGSGPSSFQMLGDSYLGGNIASGQSVTVRSDSTHGEAYVQTTGSLTNAGTITLDTATSAPQTDWLQVMPGTTLTNTGAIDVAAQPSGSPTIEVAGATLSNSGTIDIDDPTTLDGGSVTNSGTLDLGANLAVTGGASFTQMSAGVLGVALVGPSRATALSATDSSRFALAGTVAPTPQSGVSLTPGESFPLITSASGRTSGAFSGVDPTTTPTGLTYLASASPSGATLTLAGTAIVGDTEPQTADEHTQFGEPLAATVLDDGGPIAGASVTFSAPTGGAGGTFPNGSASVTAVTDAQGVATAPPFTANGVAGSYAVMATTPAATTGASLELTNVATLAPAVSLSSYALTFPVVSTGQSGGSQTLTVTNAGQGPLSFTAAPQLSGAQAADFGVQDDCSGASVPAGASCPIVISFVAGGSGPRQASLTLYDDAPDSPQVAALSSGVAATTTTTTTTSVAPVVNTSTVVTTSTATVAAVTVTTKSVTGPVVTVTVSQPQTSSTAPVKPPAASLATELGLPAAGACVSGGRLVLHLAVPTGDKLATATVFVNGHQERRLSFAKAPARQPSSTVTLTSLPGGRFTVQLLDTLRSGHTLSASATYRRCRG